jgi:hypothetical protein
MALVKEYCFLKIPAANSAGVIAFLRICRSVEYNSLIKNSRKEAMGKKVACCHFIGTQFGNSS